MNSRLLLPILAGVLLIGGLVAYLIYYSNQKKDNTPTPIPSNESQLPDNPTEPTTETSTIKLYFNKTSDQECNKVYAVERQIPKTTMIGTAALKQLFSGPTDSEATQGYTSIFTAKSADLLQSLQVKNGVAYVNLNDIKAMLPSVSSSCGSAQFLAETESTLKQFSTVKSVVFAIQRNVESFYEWIQIGCTVDNFLCDNTIFRTDVIKITQPELGKIVSSPVSIKGEAKGSWFFEGSFPIKVFDEKGKALGQGTAQTDNWMTDQLVPFTATINFSAPVTNSGVIIFSKDNPSGLPQNDDSVRLFVLFK